MERGAWGAAAAVSVENHATVGIKRTSSFILAAAVRAWDLGQAALFNLWTANLPCIALLTACVVVRRLRDCLSLYIQALRDPGQQSMSKSYFQEGIDI